MEICMDTDQIAKVEKKKKKNNLVYYFFFLPNKKQKKGQLGTGNKEDYKEVKLIRNDKTIKAICTGAYFSFIYHRKKKKN